VAEDRGVTVEELQRMSPQERVDLLKERTVTDLSRVDPEFLERANADAARALRQREAADSQQA
jgi:hypothetical protein